MRFACVFLFSLFFSSIGYAQEQSDYEKAMDYYKYKNYPKAEEHFKRALDTMDENRVKLLYFLGVTLVQNKKFHEAKKYLLDVYENAPNKKAKNQAKMQLEEMGHVIDKTEEDTGIPFGLIGTCTQITQKLPNCERYQCQYHHPFNGELLERKIIGLTKTGTCQYEETLPVNGHLTCKFSEAHRKTIMEYFSNQMQSDSKAFPDYKTTYVIDGQEVINPLDAAMYNPKICTISGYNM